jgi:transposase-like protein
MRQKENQKKDSAEKAVRDIRRATRRRFAAEEKIRIVLEGLRGEDEYCRVVPQGRHQPEPVLALVEGVPGGRQEALGR